MWPQSFLQTVCSVTGFHSRHLIALFSLHSPGDTMCFSASRQRAERNPFLSMLDPHSAHKTLLFSVCFSAVGQSRYFALRTTPLSWRSVLLPSIHSRTFLPVMFASHRPRVFRSRLGCCICGAKSSSSRFTSSSKYEILFSGCFQLNEKRQGEICNACVLLVKRWKKLPPGSSKNWKHVRSAGVFLLCFHSSFLPFAGSVLSFFLCQFWNFFS